MMNETQKKVISFCGDDESQRKVITSDFKSLMVEAPAGYGKTTVLLSKCIYLLSEKYPNYNKKCLLITFSNNGISKLKKDLGVFLDNLGITLREKIFYKSKIEILNFHSLSKRILKMYGGEIHWNLKNIYDFDFSNSCSDWSDLFMYEKAIKERNAEEMNRLEDSAFESLKKLIPLNKLTYSGILLLMKKLFLLNKNVSNFYNDFFEYVFVDEYQDSSVAVLEIIELLNVLREKRFLFGDALQNIFEFSGADPENIKKIVDTGAFEHLSLEHNYRFMENKDIKKIESSFREFYKKESCSEKCDISLNLFKQKEDEAKFIIEYSKQCISRGESAVVLIGNRKGNIVNPGMNVNLLYDSIFFNATFEDENDSNGYLTFCKDVLKIFENWKVENKSNNLRFFFEYFEMNYLKKVSNFENSYIELLKCLIYNFLMKDIYYEFRKEVFSEILENNDLIKYVEYIKEKVPIITIHRSKGMEWDNVFIVNMNKNVLSFDSDSKENRRLYYVALTRAKKDVIFSANTEGNIEERGDDKSFVSNFFNLPFLNVKVSKI
ncbi:MAG: ATP-dependent helicase [Nanoarchaeota archaeon]|jgi:DNA helicase-2/ATP-dependent DNA helicase PcrA|nr:ATP-dependent helicase [Nanoarchaeota archaeon]